MFGLRFAMGWGRRCVSGVVASVVVLTATFALAGAWPMETGQALVIATSSFSDSNMAFDPQGKLIPVSSWRKFELGFYVEYGLTDALTLIAKPTLADTASAGPPAGTYRGFQSVEAGARVLLTRLGDFMISGEGLFKAPGSTDALNQALIGATAFEAEGRLLGGVSFVLFDHPAFFDGEIAYRARNGGNPGEARLDLTLGWRPFDKVLLLLQDFSAATIGQGSFAYPAEKWSKLQPSIVYDFAPGWSAQVGGFATIAAENARIEHGALVALWRRF